MQLVGGGDDTGLVLAHSWCTVGLVTSLPPAVPELVPGAIPSVSSLPLTPPLSCRDPDSVVLCLLAIDEEEEDDIALQIHFTLIQSFCCDNDIDIVRVSGMQRLAQLLGEPAETLGTTEARDLHCLLVTVSRVSLSLSLLAPACPGHLGTVFVNRTGLASRSPAHCPAMLGMSRGLPRHPGSYFEPTCLFPKGAPGHWREAPYQTPRAPTKPFLFVPLHRTVTQIPGKAKAWWRWPVIVKRAGEITNGSPIFL